MHGFRLHEPAFVEGDDIFVSFLAGNTIRWVDCLFLRREFLCKLEAKLSDLGAFEP
jgi:hypothetical protein